MNVGQLKKLISRLPDNIPILTSAGDHAYRRAAVEVTDAGYEKTLDAFYEWHGVEHACSGAKKITALFIS